jgi:sarcosine oxidase
MSTVDVDHVVVGLGGLGSAAAYWLAEMSPDASIVGLEQFALGHDRGASHDHSRIIRYSYHSPEYVRLASEAYETWDAVAAEAGEELVVRTGGIDLFPAGSPMDINGYRAALDACDVPYEVIDASEIRRRFPQFEVADDVMALTQADTGIAPAAKGTAAHQRLARARGVDLRDETDVLRIESDGAGELTVVTGNGSYRTGSVVMCADAWTNTLLEPLDVHIPLEILREQVAYYPSQRLDDFAIGRFPVWIWMEDPCFYGFPVYGDMGAVKAAEDVGGHPTTALTRTFDTDVTALERMTAFLQRVLPTMVGNTPPRVKTCLYTMTADRDFVLDTVPGHPGLQVALGSAHGFKFASWFGRALAERAVLGATRSQIELFRLDRPAITDPSFVPNYMS